MSLPAWIPPSLAATALAAVCFAPTDASAAGQTELQALPDTGSLGAPINPRSSETRRIFINFDGPYLEFGSRDDARRDITRAVDLTGQMQPFGGSTLDRLAIVQAVRNDFAKYNVAVTSNRPADGDYVMAVVGPNRPEGEYWDKLLGTAFLDCWDAQTVNDVSFAFHDASLEREASQIARTISQEVAHGLGLEHVDDPADVMYPSSADGDPSFKDGCTTVVPASGIGIACTGQHLEVCGATNKQNSHGELLMLLGPQPRTRGCPASSSSSRSTAASSSSRPTSWCGRTRGTTGRSIDWSCTRTASPMPRTSNTRSSGR